VVKIGPSQLANHEVDRAGGARGEVTSRRVV
jgi:hypothetical protein